MDSVRFERLGRDDARVKSRQEDAWTGTQPDNTRVEGWSNPRAFSIHAANGRSPPRIAADRDQRRRPRGGAPRPTVQRVQASHAAMRFASLPPRLRPELHGLNPAPIGPVKKNTPAEPSLQHAAASIDFTMLSNRWPVIGVALVQSQRLSRNASALRSISPSQSVGICRAEVGSVPQGELKPQVALHRRECNFLIQRERLASAQVVQSSELRSRWCSRIKMSAEIQSQQTIRTRRPDDTSFAHKTCHRRCNGDRGKERRVYAPAISLAPATPVPTLTLRNHRLSSASSNRLNTRLLTSSCGVSFGATNVPLRAS